MIEGAIFIISLFVLALLTAAETAFHSVSRLSLEGTGDGGTRGVGWLLKAYQPRQRLHCITALGRAAAAVAATLSVVLLTRGALGSAGLDDLYAMLVAGFVGLVGIACAENLLASALLKESDEGPLPRFAFPLFLVYKLLFPFARIVDGLGGVFRKEVDLKSVKEEELLSIVESESEEGSIEEEEKHMIHTIFQFADTTVREVMVPRIDMVCAERSASLDELLALVKEAGHSRIPIYEDKVDNIRGVLYVKDILRDLAAGRPDWEWSSALRPAYFVPENKKIDRLLKEFKDERIHIAIVVDEYGGTAGLVTLEDLLEEIVGEIQDEYDSEDQPFEWTDDRTLLVDARIDIHDLSVLLGTDLPEDGFETLGGFIHHRLGRIPERGETLGYEGLTMSVEETDAQRISKVRIVCPLGRGKPSEDDRGGKKDNA